MSADQATTIVAAAAHYEGPTEDGRTAMQRWVGGERQPT
jgi:hypothetical protein